MTWATGLVMVAAMLVGSKLSELLDRERERGAVAAFQAGERTRLAVAVRRLPVGQEDARGGWRHGSLVRGDDGGLWFRPRRLGRERAFPIRRVVGWASYQPEGSDRWLHPVHTVVALHLGEDGVVEFATGRRSSRRALVAVLWSFGLLD